MKRFLVMIILLHFFSNLYSQRGNNWRFGNFAGLDFSSGAPISTAPSAMQQLEGSSTMSDTNGHLLFYSEGTRVWNAQNNIMPNGTGLWGHFSSTQSSMIIPFPGDPKRYYIFTVDEIRGTNGLRYSVVNMDLDGGLGDIETKNIPLVSPTSEKIASVNHCNGKDVWVITNKKNTDEYYAYLVTSTGINSPVISHSGIAWSYSSIGYLKISPDGTKLAVANYGIGLHLFDFDAITGVISNKKALIYLLPNYRCYGLEFSPNSKLLYSTGTKSASPSGPYYFDICQYNFLDSSAAKVIASKVQIEADTSATWPDIYAALQLGPDGKIYGAKFAWNYLPVINNPDRPGLACNYIRNGFLLAQGTISFYGLPDFNQSYFKGSFSYDISCASNEVKFYFTIPNDANSIRWDFGDPASGINNTSFIDSPVHVFSSPGIYQVKVITYLQCRNDTMRKAIRVDPIAVNLGSDRETCADTPYILRPQTQGNISYLWQDNSTGSTYTVIQSGLYWVEIRNIDNGCTMRDSIQFISKPVPVINLGSDTTICERSTFLLDAGNPGSIYIWQDNSTNQTLFARKAGTYFVAVNMNGCESSDTIVLQTKYIPRIFLGNDTAICNGMTLTLTPILNHAENAGFLWNTGDITPVISVTRPGFYSLEVQNSCGTGADGIIVKEGVCKLYVPTAFSPNHDGKNDIFKPGYGENVVSYSMEIYNRWGERVFSSNKLSNGWDGKFKNVLQPAGVFAWFIRYKVFNDPKEYYLKGTVTLVY